MPNNKSKEAKARNSNKGKSAREEHAQESGGGEGHGNGGEHQKHDHEFKQARGTSNPFGGLKNIGGKDLKDGCFPKLFMLFLPIMAVGTFLFIKSIAS
ncbi:MAG: hypothetical protein K8S20_01660 [Chloroflexi bacterium]|nr:hypothetical protein [Chloroflexota bacterium]